MLAAGPGIVAAQSPGASDKASSDATSSTRQSPAGAPERPPTTAGEVGDRLHDSAKSFGEALLDGLKYASNKVVDFFRDDASRDEATSRK
jgi:hypothetical protein